MESINVEKVLLEDKVRELMDSMFDDGFILGSIVIIIQTGNNLRVGYRCQSSYEAIGMIKAAATSLMPEKE